MTGSWLDSLEERARSVLPAPVFEYVAQGARDGTTAGEAVAAWRRTRFVPRVLRDVTEVSLASSLLGTGVSLPVAVAPTTLQRAADPDGEIAMATAVADTGSLMVVSSNAGYPFADIGATGVAWWLQAYLPQDREKATPMLESAVAAGARAIVLTVDTPVVGTKYHAGTPVWEAVDTGWVRVNLGSAADEPKATDLGPADIEWLGERTGLPVVVKGVLHPDDARRCIDAGAAAVWVSNHGGRQLDRAAATADCLVAVVAAVRGTEVYVDGGIRNGLDAWTAMTLGAHAVFVGRQPLYALAAAGAAGVEKMFHEFSAELAETMRLSGVSSLSRVAETPVVEGETASDVHEREL